MSRSLNMKTWRACVIVLTGGFFTLNLLFGNGPDARGQLRDGGGPADVQPKNPERRAPGEREEDWRVRLAGPLDAEDARVMAWIREEHLHPPSDLPYNLDLGRNVDFTKLQYWQRVHQGILDVLKGKRNGFFLEAGALDGYYQSNTFFLERDYNWTGLLVEPNPVFFQSLLTRHRRAWATDLCLGTKPYPLKTEFWVHTGADASQSLIAASRSGLLKEHLENYASDGLESGSVVEVNCVPAISILSALNVTQIDLFSLDIENAEVDVMQWFPFDRVHVEVLVVEHWTAEDPEDSRAFVRLVEAKGFSFYRRDNHDYFFLHRSPRWVLARPGDSGAVDNLEPYEPLSMN
ncbi:protein Star-like [Penaeus japonicus]|uniref:protein Star-like n=1 Tax=Penaeus japonicus TaxID=27405 RepID=UPI001C715D3F|nr:protein Star-like [Penaeus japonicus]